MDNKVNLFLVGAMKAGTTSFADLLSQHPDIYFCPIKEPHHFINDTPSSIYPQAPTINIKKYLKADVLKPVHLEIIKDVDDYHELFREANNHKYLAEGSTGYYHSFESADLIYKYNPCAKIIILNRNPLKRAYSHYKMDVGLGRITKDFNTILSQEIDSYRSSGFDRWNHLGMSLYKENTQRFLDLFKDNVLVVNFEEFTKNKEHETERLLKFLGLKPSALNIKHANSSNEIKYKKLVSFLFRSGLKDLGSKLLPKSLRTKIFEMMQKESREIEIQPEILERFNRIVGENS